MKTLMVFNVYKGPDSRPTDIKEDIYIAINGIWIRFLMTSGENWLYMKLLQLLYS